MNILKGLSVAAIATVTLAACAGPAAQSPNTSTETVAGVQTATEPTGGMTTVAGTETAMGATVQSAYDSNFGVILVDSSGMTLYRYANDQPDESNCYDQCAQNWPPLTTSEQPTLAAGIPGTLGTVTRADDTTQVTYDSMPLYRYVGDKGPGDLSGNGIGNVWFAISPLPYVVP